MAWPWSAHLLRGDGCGGDSGGQRGDPFVDRRAGGAQGAQGGEPAGDRRGGEQGGGGGVADGPDVAERTSGGGAGEHQLVVGGGERAVHGDLAPGRAGGDGV